MTNPVRHATARRRRVAAPLLDCTYTTNPRHHVGAEQRSKQQAAEE
jgi:hypothetical protein